MTRAHELFRSPCVAVARYDHPPGRSHRDPDEETARGWAVSFVERGAFRISRGRRTWRLAPGMMFVTRPGFTYTCEHDERIPADVCLAVEFSSRLVEEVETATQRPWRDQVPVAPLTNRTAYLGWRLRRDIAGGAGALAVETLACEIAADLEGGTRPPSDLYRSRRLEWYAERVEAARGILEIDYAAPHSLGSIARQVGMSPFHFCRVFRELTGAPPHRYLTRVRLQRAAAMLRDGTGVTQTCLAAGFNNLGHFIRSYRAAYGVTPSRHRV